MLKYFTLLFSNRFLTIHNNSYKLLIAIFTPKADKSKNIFDRNDIFDDGPSDKFMDFQLTVLAVLLTVLQLQFIILAILGVMLLFCQRYGL